MSRRVLTAFLLLYAAATRGVAGQYGASADIFAGGELENYLRYLQTLREVPLYPWGARAFSPVELDHLVPADTSHPWAARYDFASRPSFAWVSPSATTRINTT